MTEAEVLATSLLPIREQLLAIDEELAHLPDWDCRRVGVRNCADTVLVALMQLRVLYRCLAQPEIAPELLGVNGDIATAIRLFARSARMMLILDFQFQVETMLTTLANAFGIPERRKGFEGKAREVMEVSGMHSYKRRAARMYLASLMRNTLHSNGRHVMRSRQISVDGKTYIFRKGRRFSDAGWEDVVRALTAETLEIANLLGMPAVMQLPVTPDPFAFELYGASMGAS